MTVPEKTGLETQHLEQEIAHLKAANRELEKLVINAFHQTIADPAAKTDGTTIFLPPEAIEMLKAVGGDRIRSVNTFLGDRWRRPDAETALQDMRDVREVMDAATRSAYKLYWHHDICYGSALLGHLSRIFAFYVRDALDVHIDELSKDIEYGGKRPSGWETPTPAE